MIIIDILLITVLVFLSLTTLFFAIQVFVSLFAPKCPLPAMTADITKAIIIPAHDEELVIENTLRDLLKKIDANTRVLVVADNCTDRTAEMARIFDVDVIERKNPDERGKGYALEFGIRHLKSNPPNVVVIFDADCRADDNTINVIAHKAYTLDRPVQALDIMENSEQPTLKQKVLEFAFYVKNYVRPLGLSAFKIPCQLMGTGMAFPWKLLLKVDISNGNIVEDMKLGSDLVSMNKGAYFCPSVAVRSIFPTQDNALKGQKTRWEHGHIETIFSHAIPLFFKGIISFRPKVSLFALDLAIFPLSLLAIMLLLITALCGIMDYYTQTSNYLSWSLFLLLSFMLSAFYAWLVYGRKILSFPELITIPLYILGKIPIYLKLLINREKKWSRTDRDEQ